MPRTIEVVKKTTGNTIAMTITKEDWDTKVGVTLVSQTSNPNTFVKEAAAGGLAAGCGMIAKERARSLSSPLSSLLSQSRRVRLKRA